MKITRISCRSGRTRHTELSPELFHSRLWAGLTGHELALRNGLLPLPTGQSLRVELASCVVDRYWKLAALGSAGSWRAARPPVCRRSPSQARIRSLVRDRRDREDGDDAASDLYGVERFAEDEESQE